MPWLPPIFLGMVTIPPIYKNGDDWGMVQMTFFYINGGFLWTSPKTQKNTKSLDLSIRKKNNHLWFFSTWLGNPHVDDDSEQGPPMFVMWPIKVVML